MSQERQETTILNGVTATGFGTAVNVSDYEEIIVMLTMTTGSATVKFAGAAQNTEPTWASAASATNHWDYIDVTDYEDGASVDGDTGIATSSSADVRILKVSVSGLEWFNAQVSAYTSGTITVVAKARDYNN